MHFDDINETKRSYQYPILSFRDSFWGLDIQFNTHLCYSSGCGVKWKPLEFNAFGVEEIRIKWSVEANKIRVWRKGNNWAQGWMKDKYFGVEDGM